MATTTGAGGSARQDQIQHYSKLLDQKYPGNLSGENVTLAMAYIIYMNNHLQANPRAVYLTVLARLAAFGKIPDAIKKGIQGVGTGVGQEVTGAEQGLKNPLDFLSMLTSGNLWIRVAEGIVGLALIIVGLAELGQGTPIGKAATTIGKAAMIL